MSIRTILTLDDDNGERELAAESKPKSRRTLRIQPLHMGVRKGVNYDSTGALLEMGEGAGHR